MAIILTDEEKQRIKSGEITYDDLIKERGQEPDKYNEPVKKKSKIDEVKEELRKVNQQYKELIIENRELRNAVSENVKRKEQHRKLIESLREEKKKLIGASECLKK
jgi:hypothetical protein